MGKLFEGIDEKLRGWLEAQAVFFVATAPLSGDGHVNLSPKGTTGTFRVLGEHSVAYLDLTGSGIETLAHLKENGRITLMFCAFEGPPRIVRLWGQGSAIPLGHRDFPDLVASFPAHPGVRAVVRVDVTRVGDSCGYAVPLMRLAGERDILDKSNGRKTEEQLAAYRVDRNSVSIDGLPGWE